MAYDEMELDMLGDQRTAMFVIISDTDDTFNFVVSILYTQLFNLLCDKADDEHGGRLPYHVRLLLDEFANIGQIPKFDKLIATIRSREISASIILQSQSQLKTIYKDAAETIIGNCDTMLFLGGKGYIQPGSVLGQTFTSGMIVTFYMYISRFFNPWNRLRKNTSRQRSGSESMMRCICCSNSWYR